MIGVKVHDVQLDLESICLEGKLVLVRRAGAEMEGVHT